MGDLSQPLCEVSAPSFENSPRKHSLKKWMFWASIYMGKFCDLLQIFNNNYTEELNNKQLFRSEKSHL
jgi:menaquinone-dependent protoporphyrinogen IX oxidase